MIRHCLCCPIFRVVLFNIIFDPFNVSLFNRDMDVCFTYGDLVLSSSVFRSLVAAFLVSL